MTEPPVLALEQVSRRFGEVVAADQVSFEVARGEFFSLLGPSGCGKTTTLRLIAGFEEPDPDGGTVRMLGQVMNGRRPYQRPIGMVFQNYALFPHLRVAENIAFGLEEQRVPRDEIIRRVNRALELVRLDPAVYARRQPVELSGGQRQRVALARALVLEPPILLLDEPLGALDLQLRKAMQLELKELNRTLGITFVLVTHDQDEALAMSDRIAVMHRGRVAQVGTPAAIYETPRTPFVAEFIGEANLFAGVVEQVEQDLATVMGRDGVRWQVPVAPGVTNGTPLQIAVRPEWQVLSREQDDRPAGNAVAGVVTSILFRGETLHVLVTLADGRVVRVALRNEGARGNPLPWSVGERVLVSWTPRDAQVLEP